MRLLIGVDDTDAGDSIGTGALAREIAARLERDLGAAPRGITRHQLFVHPDIPYTSHNSSACIEVECAAGAGAVAEACAALLEAMFHPGADPGLCVGPPERLAAAPLVAFGRRAQIEVVPRAEAEALAREHDLALRPLGGTGLGVIGALAGAALRASADDGRFLSLPGARQIAGALTVGELLARLSIDAVVDESDAPLAADEVIDTRGWVRPDLRGGRVLLKVERGPGGWAVARKKPGEGDV
jgi:hypothetical protein